jgi:uncharacterized protein YukE
VLKERWHADASSLNEVLRTIAEGLTANTAAYASSEDTNDSGFTSMAAVLS